jgi:hypothetical protein
MNNDFFSLAAGDVFLSNFGFQKHKAFSDKINNLPGNERHKQI